MGSNDVRLEQLQHWLRTVLHWPLARIAPASADASFRRYFRAWSRDGSTRIVMDAPPGKEDIAPYLAVSALREQCRVHVPRVEASGAAAGFVLLEDLGTVSYRSRLEAGADADALYRDALEALVRIQVDGRVAARSLAAYDRAALARELALMPEWFCARHLRLELDREELALLDTTFEFLIV